MASTTPEGLQIRPRHMDFDLPNPLPRHWNGGDAFKTHLFDAMSVLFPDGERFFIDSVRHFRDRIDDPVLAQEVADFTHDCYGPSRAKLFMNRPTLGKDEMNDINWIGSSYFLETPGFYDPYHSPLPRPDWPYDTVRDAGFPEVVSGGGYPTCRQWWSDSPQGLRTQLLEQVETNSSKFNNKTKLKEVYIV